MNRLQASVGIFRDVFYAIAMILLFIALVDEDQTGPLMASGGFTIVGVITLCGVVLTTIFIQMIESHRRKWGSNG